MRHTIHVLVTTYTYEHIAIDENTLAFDCIVKLVEQYYMYTYMYM